jgi:two-component system, NtrC family, sensor kinase
VEINPLLEEILAQATHQVPLGRIEMRCDLDLTLPPLTADRERLRQVFTNLLINALQAMDGEGTLTVTSRSLRDAIEVTVADTGPGLPLELRGKIFNPFFTTKPTGTGLGLSVSYGIIQALGGTIEVGGAAGRGAVFTIRLPIKNLQTAD